MCKHSNQSKSFDVKRAMIGLIGIGGSIFAVIKMNGVEVNLSAYGAFAAALLAGHYMGDYIFQTDTMAKWKVSKEFFKPADDKEQYNWFKSIRANIAHVITYHWGMFLAVGLTGLLHHASPVKWLIALAVSMIAHGVIDRRWPVKKLMFFFRQKRFFDSGFGAPHVDQTLHIVTIVFLAAWLAM